MKALILCFVLCLSVNFCGAASIHKEDKALIGNDWKLFDHPAYDHKNKARDCKCTKYPRPVDCAEVLENGHNVSGVYTIYPRGRISTLDSLQVYCDMETDGGGWTVIQRKGDFGNGEKYFNKGPELYKKGFGNLTKEFWLGGDNIHVLTNQAAYSVRLEGTKRFIMCDTFWVEDEAHHYRMPMKECTYSDNVGGVMLSHNLTILYKRDMKAKRHEGGWWAWFYPSAKPNVHMNQGKDKQVGNGIAWFGFDGLLDPFQLEPKATFEQKIRPRRFN